MKGIHGLILAIGLGLVGALCNWFYVHRIATGSRPELFVGIRPDVAINAGDVFTEEMIEAVPIPEDRVGSLIDKAVLWKNKETVIGMKATRNYARASGEILLVQDQRTPPPELKLRPNERAMWVPLDTKTIVPSLLVPGVDQVSFLIPRYAAVDSASASDDDAPPVTSGVPAPSPMQASRLARSARAAQTAPTGEFEQLGPFTVLAVGNRLGSTEVFRAARGAQVQENVMAVLVNVHPLEGGGEQLDEKAKTLWNRLRQANFQGVGILLHPREAKKK